jgi:hypothetical protein
VCVREREFNIYEAALPRASDSGTLSPIQRAISPSTPDGAQTLRSTLLTEDNKLQWQRFEQVGCVCPALLLLLLLLFLCRRLFRVSAPGAGMASRGRSCRMWRCRS